MICCEYSCCYYYGRASFRFADAIANSVTYSVTVILSIVDSNYWYCSFSLLFLFLSPFLVLALFPPLPTIVDTHPQTFRYTNPLFS